jgi:hypothetical protein
MQLWHFLQQLPYHSVSKVPCCPGHPAFSAYFFRHSDAEMFRDINTARVKLTQALLQSLTQLKPT